MGCKVTYIPLGELAKFESGGTPSKKEERYWNGTIPWISAKTLVGDAVCKSDLFITKQGLDAGSKLAPKGSLLLLTRGSGLFKRIPLAIAEKDVAYNQDIKCIEATAEGISNRYLFYTLKALEPAISAMLETTGIGAGKLATDRLKALRIPVLDEAARLRVTYIADCINGKLSLNTKLNGYLEELFATLFSELISSRNYSYVPLTDVIFFQEGPGIRNWQYVYDGGGVNFINIRCIQSHDLDLSNANQISVEEAYGKYDRFLVKPGDILMSSSGTLGRYAIARQEHLPLCMNTSVIRFRPLADSTAYAFVYGYLTSREFYNHLTGMANGSAQVNFGPTHLKKIEVPWPDEDTIRTFNKMTMPLIETMNALRSESNKLATLRDTLLPKLMSGEIDVSKVDLTQLNSHLT